VALTDRYINRIHRQRTPRPKIVARGLCGGARGRRFLAIGTPNTGAGTADKGSPHGLRALSVLTMMETPVMMAAALGSGRIVRNLRRRPPGRAEQRPGGRRGTALGGDHVAGRCSGKRDGLFAVRGGAGTAVGGGDSPSSKDYCRAGNGVRAGTVRHDALPMPAGLAQASPPKWTRLVAGDHGGHAKPVTVAIATGPSCCRCDSSR